MGEGPDVLLLHGLGATKASFFDTAAALTRAGYRVHALDLPGFGGSSKPVAGAVLGALVRRHRRSRSWTRWRSSAPTWSATRWAAAWRSRSGCARPSASPASALLAPAVAFVKRDWHPIVRLLRPELGLLPHNLGRGRVARQFWSLFADPDQVDPSVADVVVDEFQRIYASAGARLAFLTAARNIYLDRPFGRGGFYPRLAELEPPALFVWGAYDRLIPPGFKRHVAHWLPDAEQIVLEDCGHVPQVERPEQTERPAAALLRPRRRARPAPGAGAGGLGER